MNDGRIEQEGSPIDIYQNPRTLFAATFIGTNNFLPGIVRDVTDGITIEIEDLDITLQTDSSVMSFEPNVPVWVCVRADDIDVVASHDANNQCNVIDVDVEHASLTGGFVIVEGKLKHRDLRIHLGGGRRFELLQSAGTTISCALSHIALIPRQEGDMPTSQEE
jgi:ABC-type Fe3+/spermidine/putrescine transport system ATPase subunit